MIKVSGEGLGEGEHVNVGISYKLKSQNKEHAWYFPN